MSKIVASISVLLGLMFVFFGLLKLTPAISRDLHIDFKQEFVKYAKVVPKPVVDALVYIGGRRRVLNKKDEMSARLCRQAVGTMEIMFGATMAFFPVRRTRNLANLALILLKVGNFWTHLAIDDKFERIAPTMVFILLLCCRIVVDWQVNRRRRTSDEQDDDEQFVEDPVEQRKNDRTADKNCADSISKPVDKIDNVDDGEKVVELTSDDDSEDTVDDESTSSSDIDIDDGCGEELVVDNENENEAVPDSVDVGEVELRQRQRQGSFLGNEIESGCS